MLLYTADMPKQGPQWNKQQLAIALELSQELPAKEVSDKLGIPLPTVYKIQGAIKKGFKPDLSPEAFAKAPESPGYMGKNQVTNKVEEAGSSPGKQAEKVEEKVEGKGDEAPKAAPGYISLAAIQIRSQYTPIMYMARLAATDKWGWPADMTFEDFTDIIYYHFFKDRGLTLQGYIVDDEVNKPDNGKIDALQETVDKLVKLAEAGAEKKGEEGEKK